MMIIIVRFQFLNLEGLREMHQTYSEYIQQCLEFDRMVYECPYKCLRRGTNTICGYVPSGIYNYIFGGLLVIGLAPGWGAKHSETFFLNQDLTFISFEEGQRS